MRDILITLIILSTIPYILMRPAVGVFVWSWLGYMNPHRLAFGFAFNMPFAQIVMIVTLLSIFFSKEKKSIPINATTIVLFLFILHMSITTIFAVIPDEALTQLIKVYKIQMGILVTLLLIKNKEDLHKLLWVIVFSIGFYGIKGGIFTISTAGSSRVWGPPGGYIEENNALATALLMIIPLFVYLRSTVQNTWIKHSLMFAIALCFISAIGSYSRGAFLALFCMLFFLWLKKPNKIISGVIIVIFMLGAFSLMPEQYFERLDTMNTYEEDGSAMGRINAWMVAIGIASDRFLGGGFSLWGKETFLQYAPVPDDVHAAHSIYFSVLGEHGYVGLFLFLLFLYLSWRNAKVIIKKTKECDSLKWANELAKMLQVSLIAYMSGGAFLSLSYFDLPYHLGIILVILRVIVENSEVHSNKPLSTKLPANNQIKKSKWAWEK